MLFDDVCIMALTLNFELVVFFSEIKCVLFVLCHFLIVSHFYLLKMFHDWFFWDIVGSRGLTTLVLRGVLGLEYGTTLSWVHNLLHIFECITEVLLFSH